MANYPSRAQVEGYIRAEAQRRGIDPNTAVAVARSEGLHANPAEGWQSYVGARSGNRERSYGPFQLYMGGGLGNDFQRRTGLDPTDWTTWQQQVQFALDHASRNGWSAFHGAKNTGIGRWAGLNGARPQGVSGSPVSRSSDDVRQVQQQLNALGFNLAEDGIMGPQTRNAVTTFQRASDGLAVDGIPGRQTKAALAREYAAVSAPQLAVATSAPSLRAMSGATTPISRVSAPAGPTAPATSMQGLAQALNDQKTALAYGRYARSRTAPPSRMSGATTPINAISAPPIQPSPAQRSTMASAYGDLARGLAPKEWTGTNLSGSNFATPVDYASMRALQGPRTNATNSLGAPSDTPAMDRAMAEATRGARVYDGVNAPSNPVMGSTFRGFGAGGPFGNLLTGNAGVPGGKYGTAIAGGLLGSMFAGRIGGLLGAVIGSGGLKGISDAIGSRGSNTSDNSGLFSVANPSGGRGLLDLSGGPVSLGSITATPTPSSGGYRSVDSSRRGTGWSSYTNPQTGITTTFDAQGNTLGGPGMASSVGGNSPGGK